MPSRFSPTHCARRRRRDRPSSSRAATASGPWFCSKLVASTTLAPRPTQPPISPTASVLATTSVRRWSPSWRPRSDKATSRPPERPRHAGGALIPRADGRCALAAALCADATGQSDAAREALEPIVQRLGQSRYVIVDWYPARLPHLSESHSAPAPANRPPSRRGPQRVARRNPGVARRLDRRFTRRGWSRQIPRSSAERPTFAGGDRPLATAAAREDLGRLLAERMPATRRSSSSTPPTTHTYRRRLARHGTRPSRAAVARHPQATGDVGRPDRGWESLTKSERLVVDLVARGLTNREAATELFLSPDTINAHLKHAFAKLSIRSRSSSPVSPPNASTNNSAFPSRADPSDKGPGDDAARVPTRVLTGATRG